MARNATGRNKANVVRPIGTNTNPIKFDTEGTDANGREIVLARPEVPTRIDEVLHLNLCRWDEIWELTDQEISVALMHLI